QALHGSESLCKLLRYLANHALDHPGAPLKEYQIATEVFGRQADFDPQLDSMVRVQAGRLRTKLTEHYANAGADDSVWVELPKGTYVLVFHSGPPGNGKTHHHTTATHEITPESHPEPRATPMQLPRRWVVTAAVLAILLVAALASIATLLVERKAAPVPSVSASEAVPPSFPIFWKGFLGGPEEPLVIFSNARFVGHPDSGMRYFKPNKDAGAVTLDHYTGVGEVLAVHGLDVVFASLHQSIRIKRGSLFSLDDAKNNNLIFIGSPSENLALLDIPSTKEFGFRRIPSGPRTGDTEVLNFHPRAGEASEYIASPPTQPLVEDYAVVALVPGMNPERSELILAGTTTMGTQAAVEFVCSDTSLQKLLKTLSASATSDLKPFEAVIRVKVARGVPVESEIVALRSAGH
ncbi:MAG TPA: hypothetical protein VE545_04255, partial [Candidatus Dormibacteraeota bacterium]|nr:hypothetical protein [Candidatus Dormibacteraeota bacterium]